MAGDYGASRDPRAGVTIGERLDTAFARTRAARAIATFPGRHQSSAPVHSQPRFERNPFQDRARLTQRRTPSPSVDSSAGFDPLRLGSNPETLPYLQEAELMNGRWAMHATAGILFTDAVGLPKFWEAGEAALGDWDIKTLVAIQVVVMSFLEAARIRGFMATGESGVVGNFPFDPTKKDSPR